MFEPVGAPVANPEDGEVALEVKGPDGLVTETYVLRMKTNAVCKLEQVMGEHVHKLGPRILNPGVQDLRAILCAALEDRQPGTTLAFAGDLIDRAGYDVVMAAAMQAMARGFPRAKTGATKEAPEGKGHGTGPASSPTRRKRGSVPPSSGS